MTDRELIRGVDQRIAAESKRREAKAERTVETASDFLDREVGYRTRAQRKRWHRIITEARH